MFGFGLVKKKRKCKRNFFVESRNLESPAHNLHGRAGGISGFTDWSIHQIISITIQPNTTISLRRNVLVTITHTLTQSYWGNLTWHEHGCQKYLPANAMPMPDFIELTLLRNISYDDVHRFLVTTTYTQVLIKAICHMTDRNVVMSQVPGTVSLEFSSLLFISCSELL